MPNIRQGWLESSNVDLNREFTQLMAIQRNYQACRQAMRMIDNIDAKTVTICRAGT
jgi:flagellar basal body rod protein FlgG